MPLWVEKSNIAGMSSSKADAISGATPQNGRQSYVWDGTDDKGNAVPAGEYHFYLEATLQWTNRLLADGIVNLDGKSGEIPVNIKYINGEANKDMISNISAFGR